MRHIHKLRFAAVAAAVVGLAAGLGPGASRAGAATEVRPIALSGEAAPQTSPAGLTFDPSIGTIPFYVAASHTPGRASFIAPLAGSGVNSGNGRAMYVGQRGALSLLARAGSAAPDMTGWNYSFFRDPRVFGSYVPFGADVMNPSNGQVRQGYFAGTPGNVRMIAMPTFPAPTLGGATFHNPLPPAMNTGGTVALSTGLQGTGITTANDNALYMGTPGALTVHRRAGTQADGAPAGMNYDVFGIPQLNESGTLAFNALLTGTAPGAQANEAIFYGQPNALAPVARSGNDAHGMGGGLKYDLLDMPSLNQSGKLLYRASITGPGVGFENNAGLWAGPASAPKPIMRDGGPAPDAGPGATFTSPVPHAYFLSDSGRVTFMAGVDTPTADPVNAIWAGDEDAGFDLVARIGDPAPGTPYRFSSLGSLTISPTGEVAFNASLDSPTFQYGTWVADAAGQLHKLVKTGDVVDVEGVGQRTVAGTLFGGQYTNDALVFNGSGELYMRLSFTNGTGGVFALSVPEPAVAMAALALLPLLVRRPRKGRTLDRPAHARRFTA